MLHFYEQYSKETAGKGSFLYLHKLDVQLETVNAFTALFTPAV